MVVSSENVRCLICTVGRCALFGVEVVGRLHGDGKLHSQSCALAGVRVVDLMSAWMTYRCDMREECRGTKRQLGLCGVHGEGQKLSKNCTAVGKRA